MTDRRPDIHCVSCGKYCYSAHPRDPLPKDHRCDSCRVDIGRSMRSPAMLNHAWGERALSLIEPFATRKHGFSDAERGKLPALLLALRDFPGGVRERPFEHEPDAMTAAEWKELARAKLPGFSKLHGKRDGALLRKFITRVS